RTQLLLFFFGLLAKLFGLRCRLLRLRGLLGECLLLGESFGFGLLRFFFLTGSFCGSLLGFGLHALGFSFCGLGLLLRFFGLRAVFAFSFGVGSGFGFAVLSGFLFCRGLGPSFVLSSLLHRHDSRFFRGLRSFTCSGFDRCFALFLTVSIFRLFQLLIGLC